MEDNEYLSDFVVKPDKPLFVSRAEPIDIFKYPSTVEALYRAWQSAEQARMDQFSARYPSAP
jgi:hypothetical protein